MLQGRLIVIAVLAITCFNNNSALRAFAQDDAQPTPAPTSTTSFGATFSTPTPTMDKASINETTSNDTGAKGNMAVPALAYNCGPIIA